MLITCGFYPGDLDQAERLAAWIKELGVARGHRLLVARDIRTDARPFADCGFDRVDEIVVGNDVWNKWAESANNVFRQIVTYVELVDKAPYHLWLEPDSIPLTADAFDVLEAEYKACGKPFMGDLVNVNDVPIHMSGVGIYPGQLTHYAGQAKLAVETAWDCFAADQIVPQMHTTDRILHAWKHPTFEDWASVEREIFTFKPNCVLFHASKDGSLIKLLRDKRNGTLPVPVLADQSGLEQSYGASEARESTEPMKNGSAVDQDSRGGQFISSIDCDILIKSHPPDYDLLKYCLRSIQKFAHGFKNLVLVVPEGHWPQFVHRAKGLPDNLKIQLVPEKPEDNGYLFQQTIKANAHLFTVSPYVLHIDSDTVFTGPVTPETFLRDGKPLWFVTPYENTQVPWKASTEKFIGHEVDWEYMRRLPMFIPRAVHEKIATFCEEKHGLSLGEYIMSQPEFSEFNCLGAVAQEFFDDDIQWFLAVSDNEATWPPLVALQTWSHGDHAEIIGQFETILSGARDSANEATLRGTSGGGEQSPDVAGQPKGNAHQAPPAQILSGAEIERAGEPPTRVNCPVIEHPRQIRPWRLPAEIDDDPAPTDKLSEIVIPWANQLESEMEIKRLVRELRKFQTSPAYTNRVRMELKLARVVPGKKGIKRMAVRRRRLGGVKER